MIEFALRIAVGLGLLCLIAALAANLLLIVGILLPLLWRHARSKEGKP